MILGLGLCASVLSILLAGFLIMVVLLFSGAGVSVTLPVLFSTAMLAFMSFLLCRYFGDTAGAAMILSLPLSMFLIMSLTSLYFGRNMSIGL